MQAPSSPAEPPFYSVPAFCKAHGIARSFFYSLSRQDRGPRVTKIGRRTFITRESAADWRMRMERETIPAAPRGGPERTLGTEGREG
jgi:predicted DNA-binding transcriptional regulator AlpA